LTVYEEGSGEKMKTKPAAIKKAVKTKDMLFHFFPIFPSAFLRLFKI